MKLDWELARELAYGVVGEEIEGFKVVENEMVDTTRWSIWSRLVVEDLSTGAFWVTSYSVGATEYQDERPFEDEDEVEFFEVKPVEVVRVEYRAVA